MRPFALLVVMTLVSLPLGDHARADVSIDCKSADPDVAIAGCTRFLQAGRLQANDRSLAYGYRGLAYARKGLIEAALADGNQAIEADPKAMTGYMSRARIYMRKPDLDRAMADVERV